MPKMRDKVAHSLANWILNNVASAEYRDNLGYVIEVGMRQIFLEKYRESVKK